MRGLFGFRAIRSALLGNGESVMRTTRRVLAGWVVVAGSFGVAFGVVLVSLWPARCPVSGVPVPATRTVSVKPAATVAVPPGVYFWDGARWLGPCGVGCDDYRAGA